MATNSLNALMFGSDDDSLYLTPLSAAGTTALESITDLDSPIPAAFIDCGWINEDGLGLELSDSVEKIRGHQGNAVVKTFMSSSDTTLTATLLESKLQTVVTYLNAVVQRVTGTGGDYARIEAPSSRRVTYLTGVLDLFETTESQTQWRILFPKIALGERGALAFKAKELTGYSHTLEVLGGFTILTDTASLIPPSG